MRVIIKGGGEITIGVARCNSQIIQDRFPYADLPVVDKYGIALSELSVDEDSYLVIYMPGHVSDEKCLRFAVLNEAKYVGIIGSDNKVKEIMERHTKQGASAAVG